MRNRAIHHAKRGAGASSTRQIPPVGPARVHCNAWLTAPPSRDLRHRRSCFSTRRRGPHQRCASCGPCHPIACAPTRPPIGCATLCSSQWAPNRWYLATRRRSASGWRSCSIFHECTSRWCPTQSLAILTAYGRTCSIFIGSAAARLRTTQTQTTPILRSRSASSRRRRCRAACTARQGRWTVVAFGAFGDRFDHELASINVLHRYRKFSRLILMGERMTACLLMPGRHVLMPNALIEEPTCGLLPIGGSVDGVWTSGLRWNLRGERLQFGDLVSSSNQMLSEESGGIMPISVSTTHPLVWTTVLRPDGWPHAGTDSIRPR